MRFTCTMRNNHPGRCSCGVQVPALAGTLHRANGRWTVQCATCGAPAAAIATANAALALVIRVWLAAGRVFCAPVSRLGTQFAAYQTATRAANFWYQKAQNCQVGTLGQTNALLAALRAAGFTPDVAPDLTAALQAQAAQAGDEVSAADARATALDKQLAERGHTLRPFQRTGIAWLAPRRKALLADQPGLGKTIQALCAAPAGAPVVVVCPAVAKGVWMAEAQRFRPDLTPVVISGRNNFRWAQPGEMVIVNYQILVGEKPAKKGFAATLPAALVTAPAGTVLIADEAQALTSSSALQTARFRALRDATLAADGRVWLLTGSPLGNRAPELWAICQAAGSGREVFGDYDAYRRMWNAVEGRYGMEWGAPTSAVASNLQKFMLRRMKAEVLTELPAKTIQTIEVNGLPAAVKALCDETLAALAADGIDLDGALATAQESDRSLSFAQLSKARAALATVKLGAAEELIESYEDANEPVVVFSAHRAPVDALGKRTGWAAITGDTSADERSRIVAEFQAGRLRGIAASIRAAGVAITLTTACNAIFIDEEWNPEWNTQAQDRIYRMGQSRGVMITRLVAAHALDRRIAALLADKATMINETVNAAARGANEVVAPELPVVDAAQIAADTERAIGLEVAVLQAERAAVTVEVCTGDVTLAIPTECPF